MVFDSVAEADRPSNSAEGAYTTASTHFGTLDRFLQVSDNAHIGI